jgi:hypothetical protein
MTRTLSHSQQFVLPEDGIIDIVPWPDPVIEQCGYDMRSRYVELFWLGVLGPTATWFLRRCSDTFDDSPDGFRAHLDDFAGALGLSYTNGRHSPFARAVQRCVMFGMAHHVQRSSFPTIAVRTWAPPLPARHLTRLPEGLRVAHDDWMGNSDRMDGQGYISTTM